MFDLHFDVTVQVNIPNDAPDEETQVLRSCQNANIQLQ
jgi:hypothetical protein